MHPSAPARPAIIKQSACRSNYSHLSQSYEQRHDWIKALLSGPFLAANDTSGTEALNQILQLCYTSITESDCFKMIFDYKMNVNMILTKHNCCIQSECFTKTFYSFVDRIRCCVHKMNFPFKASSLKIFLFFFKQKCTKIKPCFKT